MKSTIYVISVFCAMTLFASPSYAVSCSDLSQAANDLYEFGESVDDADDINVEETIVIGLVVEKAKSAAADLGDRRAIGYARNMDRALDRLDADDFVDAVEDLADRFETIYDRRC